MCNCRQNHGFTSNVDTGLSIYCRQRMGQDFRVFIYRHLSVSLLPHLAIADKHAGLAPKRPRKRRPRAVAPMLSREASI